LIVSTSSTNRDYPSIVSVIICRNSPTFKLVTSTCTRDLWNVVSWQQKRHYQHRAALSCEVDRPARVVDCARFLHEPANHFLCSANDSNSSKLRVGILQRWPDMGFRLLSLSPDSAADLSLLLFSACPKRLVRVHAVGSEVKRPCRSSNRKLGRMYRTWRFRDRIFDISPFLKYRLWYVFDASGKFCYEIIAKCWFWIL